MRMPLRAILPLVLLLVLAVSASSQEDMVVVDNGAFEMPRRSAAVFVHDEHNETAGIEECGECHHVYDDEGNRVEDESSEDQMCADCHGSEDEGRKPALMKAYHLNCKGCHATQGAGPVMCGECHRKN